MKKYLVILCLFSACQSNIYLVRHAEKADSSHNPPLSETGRKRALVLADALQKMRIDAIYATNFDRTTSTARPLAQRISLPVYIYDSSKDSLAFFIEKMKQIRGKNVLIVGHSNTLRHLVNGLAEKVVMTNDIPDSRYDDFFLVKRRFLPIRKMKFYSLTYGNIAVK